MTAYDLLKKQRFDLRNIESSEPFIIARGATYGEVKSGYQITSSVAIERFSFIKALAKRINEDLSVTVVPLDGEFNARILQVEEDRWYCTTGW